MAKKYWKDVIDGKDVREVKEDKKKKIHKKKIRNKN